MISWEHSSLRPSAMRCVQHREGLCVDRRSSRAVTAKTVCRMCKSAEMCLDGTGSVLCSIVRNWGAAVKDAVREPATRPEQRQRVQLPVHLRPALYPPVFVLVGAWQRCRCAVLDFRFHWSTVRGIGGQVSRVCDPSFTGAIYIYINVICDIGREYDIRIKLLGYPLSTKSKPSAELGDYLNFFLGSGYSYYWHTNPASDGKIEPPIRNELRGSQMAVYPPQQYYTSRWHVAFESENVAKWWATSLSFSG